MRLVFIVCPSRGLPKHIQTKLLTTRFMLYKAFSNRKKRSGTSPPASFSALILKKNIPIHCMIVFTF